METWRKIVLWGLSIGGVFALLGLMTVAQMNRTLQAELGRQPWIVYGLMRTSEGLSAVVKANVVLSSLILFTLLYVMLFAVFIYLLNDKIQHGPLEGDLTPDEQLGLSHERNHDF